MEMPPGFADKMHVDDATSELSSSSISSPPVSPQNNALFDTIRVSRPSYSHPGLSGGGVVANAASATSAKQTIAANNAAHATNGNVSTSASTTNANGSAPDKPKRQRKKKEVRILIRVTCLHIQDIAIAMALRPSCREFKGYALDRMVC